MMMKMHKLEYFGLLISLVETVIVFLAVFHLTGYNNIEYGTLFQLWVWIGWIYMLIVFARMAIYNKAS